ncbi:MAG: glycosyltransferase family 39 protein [Polyangiaceae bacterium]|nr:glycosyltransferase family 39 protein [Myxococcales bacterium]MCB9586183.1 glycosyltransferase family 39 protein [Polyangiaceae bacterium]MCB9606860.1 glycosyltransferase family 39 protein [Polyangiaceae bacterium]
MSERRGLLAIAGAGGLLRLWLALRNLDVVDRLFVPDDTYYTLSIARSLADGVGPSINGQLTSGFQPLLAFIAAPVFAITSNPDAALRFVLILGAISDAFCIFALGDLARRLGGRHAGVLAAALWALSPAAVSNALGGLETSLALALELWLVVCWCELRSHSTRKRAALCGLLAGLALLARVDAVFLVAGLGVSELLRRSFKTIVVAAGVAALVVAPWWLYSWVQFGSVIPESGGAVREIVRMHQSLYLKPPMQIGWALGSLLGVFGDTTRLKQALFDNAGATWAALIGAVVLGASFAKRWLPLNGPTAPITAFAAHGVLLLGFYALFLPAIWFFPRYLAATEAGLVLAVAVFVSRLRTKTQSRVGYAAFACGLAYAAATTLPWLFLTPEQTPSKGLHGAKGYREAAREVLELLPEGATVGALQSGALSYYAPGDVRVINLDGVVDAEALDAGKAHQLSGYAKRRGVTHFADWKFNFEAFVRLSRPEELPQNVRFVDAASPQGDDRFFVYALEW